MAAFKAVSPWHIADADLQGPAKGNIDGASDSSDVFYCDKLLVRRSLATGDSETVLLQVSSQSMLVSSRLTLHFVVNAGVTSNGLRVSIR